MSQMSTKICTWLRIFFLVICNFVCIWDSISLCPTLAQNSQWFSCLGCLVKGLQVCDTLCLAPVWHFNFHFRGAHPARWHWSLLRIPAKLPMASISLMNLYKGGDPINAPLKSTPENFHGSQLLLSDWHFRFSVCFIEMLIRYMYF